MPAGPQVRLLTFNCLWRGGVRARFTALGRRLNEAELDVVCLQEVVFRRSMALLRELTPGFPYAAYQPYGVSLMGGLLTLSRWPIEAKRYVVYRRRGRWHTLGFSDWLIRKGLLVTALRVDGARLVVVNTHLLANYDGDWARGNDYALRELAQLGPGPTLVVAGDLNVPTGSWLFDEFVRATGLRDVFDGVPETTWRPAAERGLAQAIDHVLVRPGLGSHVNVEARTVFREPVALADGRQGHLSDHLGIEARIEVRHP